MAWEGSCRERVGWRALTVPGDDSRPLLTYMLPLFSVMMRLHARRLLPHISGGRSIVVKLEYQDKRLRRVFCCRNCLLTAGKNRPLLSAPAPLPLPSPPFSWLLLSAWSEEGELGRGRAQGPLLSSRGFVFQGTLLLWVPRKGLYLFAVFYTFGNIASIGR